jgi:hypothetical protein
VDNPCIDNEEYAVFIYFLLFVGEYNKFCWGVWVCVVISHPFGRFEP